MQITIVLTSPGVEGRGEWLKEAEFAELLELYLGFLSGYAAKHPYAK